MQTGGSGLFWHAPPTSISSANAVHSRLSPTPDELAENEARLRATFDLAPVGLAHLSPSGVWLRVNRRLEELLGYGMAELVGTPVEAVTHPDDLAADLRALVQLLVGEEHTTTLEKRYVRRDSTVFWARVGVTVVRRDGRPFFLVATVEDITAHKDAVAALERREAEFRSMIEHAPDIVARFDLELRHLYVSPAITSATGLLPEQLIGRTNRELGMPASLVEEWERGLREVMTSGNTWETEFSFVTPVPSMGATKTRRYWGRVVPERDTAGSIVGAVSITRELTARTNVGSSTASSGRPEWLVDTYLVQAMEAGGVGAWWSEHPDGAFWATPRALALHGFPPDASISPAEALACTHPEDVARVRAVADDSVRRGVPYRVEYRVRHPGDVVRWVRADASVVKTAEGTTRLVGVVRDISDERARAAASPAQNEQGVAATGEPRDAAIRFRRIAESGIVGVFSWTLSGGIEDANDAFLDMLGYSRDDLVRGRIDWRRMTPPEWAAADAAGEAELLATGRHPPFEKEYLSAAGKRVPVIIASALFDKSRERGICVCLDNTERKRAERELARLLDVERRLRSDAEVANRTKSDFLAAMSHELRTPLNAIIGFTRIVRRKAEGALPAKQTENLDKVLTSAEHLLALINTVLDIAKIEAGRMDVTASTFNAVHLLDQCVATATPLLKSGVALVKRYDADAMLVHSDQEKIKQILLNVLGNAAKFTHAGSIIVSATIEDGALTVAVTDTGIGIDAGALSRIFEEFQQADTSTTRRYGGTGLGLSISRSLARLLGGDIHVASAMGEGSTFTLRIPQRYGAHADAPAREAPAPLRESRTPAHATKRRLVLAIDDNCDDLELLRENLNESGYEVVGAANGEEGLAKAKALRPHLITLDVMMPVKDGWQVLFDLKADPATRDIPVVMLTIVDQKPLAYELGAADYLLKPFDNAAIVASLSRISRRNGGHAPRRVLVADDDPHVHDMVRQLVGEQYELRAANDGIDALAAIDRERPDVVLLDLVMPRLDGFGVLQRMREHPAHRTIPVVVLTAKSLTAAEAKGLEAGVTNVVRKQGLAADVLIREIEAAVATS